MGQEASLKHWANPLSERGRPLLPLQPQMVTWDVRDVSKLRLTLSIHGTILSELYRRMLRQASLVAVLEENMTMPNDNFMTIVEASAKLGKSPRTIQRWVEEGRLPGHKVQVGGDDRWVVDVEKVKDNVNVMIKPPADAQAEILDLREEVAWLKEQLQAKDAQSHELHVLLQQKPLPPLPEPKKGQQFRKR